MGRLEGGLGVCGERNSEGQSRGVSGVARCQVGGGVVGGRVRAGEGKGGRFGLRTSCWLSFALIFV
jgi:hypothetical protein